MQELDLACYARVSKFQLVLASRSYFYLAGCGQPYNAEG